MKHFDKHYRTIRQLQFKVKVTRMSHGTSSAYKPYIYYYAYNVVLVYISESWSIKKWLLLSISQISQSTNGTFRSSEKEFAQVCTGINLEATCDNPSCKAVRNFGGLVVIRYPGITSCTYQQVVPYLSCPCCGNELRPEKVKGVVFVRCEAKISIGADSVVFRVRDNELSCGNCPILAQR